MEETRAFKLSVSTKDDLHPLAEARKHQLVLDIKKSSAEDEFSTAATFLTVLSAWMLIYIQYKLMKPGITSALNT